MEPSGRPGTVDSVDRPSTSRAGSAASGPDSGGRGRGQPLPRTASAPRAFQRRPGLDPHNYIETSNGRVRRKSIERLRNIFSDLDCNGDGKITKEEMEQAMARSTSKVYKSTHGQLLVETFYSRVLQKKGKDGLTFKDILRLMYPNKSADDYKNLDIGTAPQVQIVEDAPNPVKEEDVDEMFDIWDEDGSGQLDKEEFKQMLRKLGVSDEAELEDYFNEIDQDGGGTVTVEELKEWWFG